METIKIKAVFTDLEEAIRASNNAYGLTAYDPSELVRKQTLLKNSKYFYLSESNELYYVSTLRKYKILHKFSWIGCLHNGDAAFVSFIDGMNGIILFSSRMEKATRPIQPGDSILIGDYKFNRNYMRGDNLFWTIS